MTKIHFLLKKAEGFKSEFIGEGNKAFAKLNLIKADDEIKPLLELSKKERNVIVFMMDRAISSYLLYILEENQKIRDEFEGFVFYPNTVSASNKTLHGTPCLFGGYDYSLQNLRTTRKDTELRVKHN